MFRKLAFVLGVCAVVGVASAAVFKVSITTFLPVGPGEVENPNADGLCRLTFNDQTFETKVHLLMHGLKPNTTYGVLVDSLGAGASDPLAFTTNPQGRGSYHSSIAGDATQGVFVVIYIWDGNPDPFSIFEVTPEEERAAGSPDL